MNDKKFIEKSLKSYIKTKKIGYTIALLVNFLINGSIVYGEEININELKAKIEKNNKEIEEIEKRIVELLKEGDYYVKTLEDNKQFFFPLNIEHRHSNKTVGKVDIPWTEMEPSKPIIKPTPIKPAKPIIKPTPIKPAKPVKPEIPDFIEIGKPLKPEIPEKKPTLPSDDVIEIDEIKNIEIKAPSIDLTINKPTVHFDREYIEDIQLGIDGEGIKVENIEIDENVSEAVNIPDYKVNANSPVKKYSYNPTVAGRPEIFEVGDVRHPEEINLPDIKVNTNSFPQGSGGIIGFNGNDHKGGVNQAVVENYSQYIADDEKTVKITFKDKVDENNKEHSYVEFNKNDMTLSTDKVNVHGWHVDKDKYYNKFRNEYYRNPPNPQGQKREWLGKTATFISNTMNKDSFIRGKWELDYAETDYNEKVTRIFISVNPAGLGGNTYNDYGKIDGGLINHGSNDDVKKGKGVTTDFTGEVTLTNKTENGTLVAMDHQLWDSYVKNDDYQNEYYNKKEQLEYYSIAKNSGTINLGNENGEDKNLVGITINQERETSALLKLNNHVTFNDGVINVNGSNSLGISYEFGGGIQDSERNGAILAEDLYTGNINLNSNSKESYGIRLQNVFYNVKSNLKANTEFTNKHFYDNTRIFGSLEDNQGKEKENIQGLVDKENKDTKIKKIKVDGSNNAGFVVAKSLSSGAERYLKNTEENKKKNKENNIRNKDALNAIYGNGKGEEHLKEDYIGKFNSDLKKDDGSVFEGFDFGMVNPIANIHGLNIEVNGNQNVGFLRHKDYSDNNTNDMIITKESTGAIKNIDFGANANNSILIRSDMYGIEVQKDLTIEKDGIEGSETNKKEAIDTTEKPQEQLGKNIILQATKSTWKKLLPKKDKPSETEERDVLSVGHIINSGTIKSTQDNMIGMMSNTANIDEFKEDAEALNGYKVKDAMIINKNKIELTGKNVIGMAVLDGNRGILENGKVITQMNENAISSVEEKKDYNVSIYNDGNFEIRNSTVETSGKGSVAVYNNNGTITINDSIDMGMTINPNDEKNSSITSEIKATKGAIALYGKGGDITVGAKTTITSDTGIGVYAVNSKEKDATINLDGATIKVGEKGKDNGDAGLVAIGKAVNENDTKDVKINRGGGNSATINLENSTLDYSGKGYALYTEGNGKINVKNSTINLDGSAFGMNVIYGADEENQAIKFDNNSKIHVKSNDVTVFNIISNKDKEFSSNVSELSKNIGKALGGFDLSKNITHADGITSYKNAMVDGGSITIDKSISKSDEKKSENDEDAKNFGYFYFKRFLGQRLKTTVSEDVNIDATIDDETADNYYDGKVTGLEIVSSQNAKTVGETSLTMKKGSSIVANRLAGDKTKDNTVGVFSDYAEITMEDGSSITVEKTTDSKIRDDAFNGIGIFAVNGSKLKIGENKNTLDTDTEKAKITVYGDNAIGIYATANRSSYDGDKENIIENEYGTDAVGQGKINIENNGIIDVSKGNGTIGIYANNNSKDKNIENSKVVNTGTIITGGATQGNSSVGIVAKASQISNSGVINVSDGDGDGDGNIGIHATENSIINDLGTIKLGKHAIGVLVDETSKIELKDKKKGVKFENLDKNSNSELKIGIAYNNSKNEKTEKKHDFDVNAKEVKGIKVIAQKGGTLNITKTSNIIINDEDSAGIVVTEGIINNNGTIDIEKLSDETKANGDKKVSVGILANGKNATINNNGTINLNGDNAVGIYVKNEDNSSNNIIDEVGTININGKNNKGIYVNNSNDKTEVENKDLVGINFTENATQSTGLYLKNSKVKFNLKDEAVTKDLGKENAGNVFIKAIETDIENSGKLVISSSDDKVGRENSGNQKNIGILLDEKSTYKGSNLNNGYGIVEVMNGAIGMYSMVGENKKFTDINLAVDSQNKDTIGLVLKGKEGAESKVELSTTTGRTNKIELKNTKKSQAESNANHRNAIGIVAKDVDLNIRRVDLNYNESNGIGLYLKANSSITDGTLNITGSGKENHNGHFDYSIGIYASEKSGENLNVDLNIGKDNSIGIFNDREDLVYNGRINSSKSNNAIGIYTNKNLTFAGGIISMKGGENEKEASAGIYSEGKEDKLNNVTLKGRGAIVSVNNKKDVGIFGKYTILNNNGKINVNSGIGALIKGKGSIFNGKDGVIKTNTEDDKRQTALYLVDGAKLGNGIGELSLGKDDIGIYGENTVLDGSSFDKKDKEKRGKIDISSSSEAIGIVVDKNNKNSNGEKNTKTSLEVKNLDISLGENGIGLVSLDNDTTIENVKISSDKKSSDKKVDKTTGIYLKNKDGVTKNFNVKGTEVNLVKGYGIITSDIEDKAKAKTLNLENSKIRVKNPNESVGANSTDTSIGVYLGKNNNLDSKGNIYTIEDGVAIYGQENSTINLAGDIINLKGKTTGVFSNGGKVVLDKDTKIGNMANNTSGGRGAVFVKNGEVENSSSTIGVSDSFYGIFVEGNGKITNTKDGYISLTGKENIGIALKGNGEVDDNIIVNNGVIKIQAENMEMPISEKDTADKKQEKSIGIYGENTEIQNNGRITINGNGVGILQVNEKQGYKLSSKEIGLSGRKGIGALLIGKGNGAEIGNITADDNSSENVGVFLRNYNSDKKVTIGDIKLNDKSLGLYVKNLNTIKENNVEKNVIDVNKITVGENKDSKDKEIKKQSIGAIFENTTNSITELNIQEEISAGENGVAIYNKSGTLKVNDIEKLKVGKGSGALIHNAGEVILDTKSEAKELEISVEGHNGFVIGLGASIKATENLAKKDLTLKVSEGGTGVVFTDHSHNGATKAKPTMEIGVNKIQVQGNNESYTQGVYFNKLGEITEEFTTKLEQLGEKTIGIVLNKTYGNIKTNIKLTKGAKNSIGLLIENNEKNTTNIEGNISVEGDTKPEDKSFGNIGVEAVNSSLTTKGDISVGEGYEYKNSYPIGIFASNNSDSQLSYSGEGNLTVGNFGTGIATKNYNVDYSGNMKVGVGAVGILSENDEYSSDKKINVKGGLTIGDDNQPTRIKGVGIYGKNTDISLDTSSTLGMNILSNKRNTGILSFGQGDVTYKGNVTISGFDKGDIKKEESSVGIYKYGTGKVTVSNGDWKIGSNSIGIVANSEIKDAEGKITEENGITIDNSASMTVGKNSLGIYSVGNNTLTNTGSITVSGADENDSSVGIYMGNSKEGKAKLSVGTNTGNILVNGKNSVGVQAVGNVEFHNQGKIDVLNGGIGMVATQGAEVYNDEKGIINLGKEDGSNSNGSIGMYATGSGSSIINKGTINANNGVGMYVEDGASLNNQGNINLKNGFGIIGNGNVINKGSINIEAGFNGTDISQDEKLDESISKIISISGDTVNIGSGYIGMGGVVNSELNIELDNPMIDITLGNGLGFKAPEVNGKIGIAPNFALTGNGFDYKIEDFVDKNTDLEITTSPLFDANLDEKDLVIKKVDYKNVLKDYKYETFYNSLDTTLKSGVSSDIDAIKNMNQYLESFGNTGEFYNEYTKTMSEVRGNVYSNVQSRIFDINRSFDNSFDEMEQSYNLSKDTDKYSVIYTGGDYKSGRIEIPDYKYQIAGLQYMKEFEEVNYDNKYGYTFGFTGSKFKFKDNGRSKENIYSLRAGLHNVKSFNQDLDLLTKLDIGLNYHDMTRKLAFGLANYKNDADFYSYYVGLDNKFRKTIFKDYQNEFGAYIGTELEYGRFSDIKEDGTLALKVKSNDYYIAKGMAGFTGTGRKYLGNDWTAKLTGDVGYSYDFAKYDENKTKLRNSDSSYTSILDEIDTKGKVTGRIGIGFERLNHLGVTLEGEASRDIARDEDYWRVGLRFNYKFNQEEAVTTLRNVFHLMNNHFDFDKDNLKPEEEEIVKVGSKIIDTFNLKGTLRLEGHTDSYGSVKYNQGLSERRAERVKKEFMKNIKKSENIKYETQGYSELKPVDTNKTKKGRANNRRTEVKYIAK